MFGFGVTGVSVEMRPPVDFAFLLVQCGFAAPTNTAFPPVHTTSAVRPTDSDAVAPALSVSVSSYDMLIGCCDARVVPLGAVAALQLLACFTDTAIFCEKLY